MFQTKGCEELSSIVGSIYEATLHKDRFKQAMEAMASVIGAQFCAIFIGHRDASDLQCLHVHPESTTSTQEYIRNEWKHDPMIAAVLADEPGKLHNSQALMTNVERETSPFYKDWLVTTKFWHSCAAYFPLDDNSYIYIAFAMDANAPLYTAEQLDALQMLLPHLGRAIRIHNHLDQLTVVNDWSQDRSQQLGIGLILIDENNHVTYCSPIAMRTLKNSTGLSIRNHHLVVDSPATQKKLDALIEQSITLSYRKGLDSQRMLSIPQDNSDDLPLSLTVSPYKRHHAANTALASAGRAVVLLFDPSRSTPNHETQLQELYGLSASEASVANGLVAGESVDEIAQRMSLSKETIRSRLKRVFSKTNTTRQAELIRLVLLGPTSINYLASDIEAYD